MPCRRFVGVLCEPVYARLAPRLSSQTVPRRALIIANPVSGARRRALLLHRLRQALQAVDWRCDTRITQAAGDAESLARRAAAEGIDTVIAVGGDGTVRQAAAGLIESDTSLAVLPAGTENLFARSFAYTADPQRLASIIARGTRTRIDVGLADGRPFLVMAGLGFDAESVVRVTRRRRGHILKADYFWPLWRTFWSHRFPRFRVSVDGEAILDGPGMVFVGNLARYAIGLRLLRDANPADGLLDVCAFRCAGRARLLLHSWRALRGHHVGATDVSYGQGRSIEVRVAAETPCQLDGDVEPLAPAVASSTASMTAPSGRPLMRVRRFTLLPRALWLCTPDGRTNL